MERGASGLKEMCSRYDKNAYFRDFMHLLHGIKWMECAMYYLLKSCSCFLSTVWMLYTTMYAMDRISLCSALPCCTFLICGIDIRNICMARY